MLGLLGREIEHRFQAIGGDYGSTVGNRFRWFSTSHTDRLLSIGSRGATTVVVVVVVIIINAIVVIVRVERVLDPRGQHVR